jgi:COMPASS component SPP1
VDHTGQTVLTHEETTFLQHSAADRLQLGEETMVCKQMLLLLELANERRKAAIDAKKMESDICGYDFRLDDVSVQHQFAAWMQTDGAKGVFQSGKLGAPGGGDSLTEGMCDRKRCKAHAGWFNMLTKTIRHQIKELAREAKEKLDAEEVVRDAAEERHLRKQKEANWVEMLDDKDPDEDVGMEGDSLQMNGEGIGDDAFAYDRMRDVGEVD